MMVDDESINLKAIEKHLRGAGFENFLTTTDSTVAVSMIERERPDIVLLDIVMPQVNGLELLRQIRADARTQYLPVIILTAHRDPLLRREAFDAGCTDFLAKPIDPFELALRVRNTLIVKAHHDQVVQHADKLQAEIMKQAEALVAARDDAELRYHAGKAEIATDVLHNIGNALNSVHVGVSLISETVRESKVLYLKRAVDLLRQHEADLAVFLRDDKRGQMLPCYLSDVTDSLLKERSNVATELERLTRHLKHIDAIVSTQQEHAVLRHVHDEVALDALLNDVEELLHTSLANTGIRIQRDYEPIPSVWTDRQKLVQVLLNILKNAVESIQSATEYGNGRIELRLGRQSDERAFIEVIDNGVGILEQHLIQIYSHGFTTKPNGHGFGLHSCANLVKQLGGSIQAFSQGVGQGASFRIELPFGRQER